MTSTFVDPRFLRALGGIGIFAFALAMTPAASAEPSASDNETARQLLREGLKLRDASDVPGAIEKLKAADALVHTAITGSELAKTYLLAGKLVEARDTFRAVVRLPEDRETDRTRAARSNADQMAKDLAPRIPTITLLLHGPAASATIAVDDETIPTAALTSPRSVNPGSHHVTAKMGTNVVANADVTVKESETRQVELTIPEGAAPAPSAVATASSAPTQSPPLSPPPTKSKSPLVFVGFGLAGVGAIVGGITGAMTLTKASSLKSECTDGHCGPSHFSDLDSAKTLGTVSTIAFATAGAGLGLAVVGLVVGGKPTASHEASLTPVIGPTSLGLRGSF